MINIVHTGWKIVSLPFEEYCDKKWREVKVLRYKEIDKLKFELYAKSQIGKRYDWITLLVQAVYILTGKRLWLGKRGDAAQQYHVCSEFAGWCIKEAELPHIRHPECLDEIIDRPWLATAGDFDKCTAFEDVTGKEYQSGDIVVIKSHFMWKYLESWTLAWLSWAIRVFTKSKYNHVGVLVVE